MCPMRFGLMIRLVGAKLMGRSHCAGGAPVDEATAAAESVDAAAAADAEAALNEESQPRFLTQCQ